MKTIKKSQIKAMVNEAVVDVLERMGVNESLTTPKSQAMGGEFFSYF